MDVVVTGTPEAPGVVMVFTPGAVHEFRSTLSGRYRFVTLA